MPPATRGSAIAIVLAGFNHAQKTHGVPSPWRGLKNWRHRPRLQLLSAEHERLVYSATDEPSRNFLFATIHTDLRKFCEVARSTADDVVKTERGMMCRVRSAKTKKLARYWREAACVSPEAERP